MSFFIRANCKTALPGKIDDFEDQLQVAEKLPLFIRQGQPFRVGRGERMQMASKGRTGK